MIAESQPPPPGATELWSWGPPVSACGIYLLHTCWKHFEQTASGSHPTKNPRGADGGENWCIDSCGKDGCDKDQWDAISDEERVWWNSWCGTVAAHSPRDTADPKAGRTEASERACQTRDGRDTRGWLADREHIEEVVARSVAAVLDVDVDELKAAVAPGRGVCEIADILGVDLAEAWRATTLARRDVVRTAEEEGLVNQAQAEWITELLAEPPTCLDKHSD
jgi:hypothetical protein